MTEPIQPPRMFIRLTDYTPPQLMTRRVCCNQPAFEFVPYVSQSGHTGTTIYCANCDTDLVVISWNRFDMEEYSKQESAKRADNAAETVEDQADYHEETNWGVNGKGWE